MRSAVRREDERLRRLVDDLDRTDAPMAETWRRVAAAAADRGQLRPSYALVRRLVLARRERERARADVRQVAVEAAGTLLVGRVPDVSRTLDRLYDAQLEVAAAEARVGETRAAGGRRATGER